MRIAWKSCFCCCSTNSAQHNPEWCRVDIGRGIQGRRWRLMHEHSEHQGQIQALAWRTRWQPRSDGNTRQRGAGLGCERMDPESHKRFVERDCKVWYVNAEELENGIKDLITLEYSSVELENLRCQAIPERNEFRERHHRGRRSRPEAIGCDGSAPKQGGVHFRLAHVFPDSRLAFDLEAVGAKGAGAVAQEPWMRTEASRLTPPVPCRVSISRAVWSSRRPRRCRSSHQRFQTGVGYHQAQHEILSRSRNVAAVGTTGLQPDCQGPQQLGLLPSQASAARYVADGS
jgi:hypothetical protein